MPSHRILTLYGAIHSGVFYSAAKIGISAHRCSRVGWATGVSSGLYTLHVSGATLNIDTLHCLRPPPAATPNSTITVLRAAHSRALKLQNLIYTANITCYFAQIHVAFIKLPLVQHAKWPRFLWPYLSLKANTPATLNEILISRGPNRT